MMSHFQALIFMYTCIVNKQYGRWGSFVIGCSVPVLGAIWVGNNWKIDAGKLYSMKD